MLQNPTIPLLLLGLLWDISVGEEEKKVDDGSKLIFDLANAFIESVFPPAGPAPPDAVARSAGAFYLPPREQPQLSNQAFPDIIPHSFSAPPAIPNSFADNFHPVSHKQPNPVPHSIASQVNSAFSGPIIPQFGSVPAQARRNLPPYHPKAEKFNPGSFVPSTPGNLGTWPVRAEQSDPNANALFLTPQQQKQAAPVEAGRATLEKDTSPIQPFSLQRPTQSTNDDDTNNQDSRWTFLDPLMGLGSLGEEWYKDGDGLNLDTLSGETAKAFLKWADILDAPDDIPDISSPRESERASLPTLSSLPTLGEQAVPDDILSQIPTKREIQHGPAVLKQSAKQSTLSQSRRRDIRSRNWLRSRLQSSLSSLNLYWAWLFWLVFERWKKVEQMKNWSWLD